VGSGDEELPGGRETDAPDAAAEVAHLVRLFALADAPQFDSAPQIAAGQLRAIGRERRLRLIQSLWPSSVANSVPSRFHSLIFRSAPAVASMVPSGGKGDGPDGILMALRT
jgi:hypothetical protein